MLREDIKGLQKATARDLRKFGLTVGGVFVLFGLFFLWRHKPWHWWLFVPGTTLVMFGAILPRSLKWIFVVWMTVAMGVGVIVSTVLLTLMFLLIMTPIGLVARLVGKDFLSRRRDVSASSYWILRDRTKLKQKSEHERQF